jgi:hypothetical protein
LRHFAFRLLALLLRQVALSIAFCDALHLALRCISLCIAFRFSFRFVLSCRCVILLSTHNPFTTSIDLYLRLQDAKPLLCRSSFMLTNISLSSTSTYELFTKVLRIMGNRAVMHKVGVGVCIIVLFGAIIGVGYLGFIKKHN